METQEISESVFHYYLKKNSEPKIIFKPGEQITIIVHTEQSGSVDILEFEDALFYSGSAVLHAEGVMTDADGEQKVLNGIAMLAKVITYAAESAEKNTPKKIILTGHTDSTADTIYNLSLSQARSRSVYYLLTGDRDNWVKTVEERCNPEKGPLQQLNYRNYDLRQVLMWVATSPDVAQYCKDAGSSESTDWSQAHPGKIDDSPVNDDVKFRSAVKGFRNAYQTAFLNGGTKYKNASQGADHWG